MSTLILHTVLYGLLRWLHLLAVVMAVGGAFVMRYVLLPALDHEPDERRREILRRIRARLAVIVPTAIGLLIVSGLVNLLRALTLPPSPPTAYHIVFGVKMLLAFALFAFATLLVLPADPPNAFQRRARFWLTMNAHLGFLIMALSVALRFLSGK